MGVFGNYELLEEVGHGGMGIIYRARELTLNRVVALKLMLAGHFANAREVKRFRSEAEAAARLEHPNIVPIYEFGELEGRPFLSMRFVEGKNLADQLGGRPMNPRPAALLVRTLARAIHYAHQRGILHRDLKPANILLDAEGEPHVTDFGLAKCLDSNDGLTLSGAMLGSPNYMSPEQAAGHPERLTTAADIYSLGAILYELLAGRPPFCAATPLETMRKVMEESPPAPRTIHDSTDRELETICLKCMEKEPDRRYGSAEALAEDLERWLRHDPILARPIGTVGRIGKWTRRNPGTATLVLLCGLATMAFVAGQTVMSLRLSRANTRVAAANANLTRSLYEAQWGQADEAARTGERGEAIARFSHFLREDPMDGDAAARLLSLLSTCNFPVLLLPPLVHEAPVRAMDFNEAGDRLATATSAGTARLWNIDSGQLELELAHPAPLTHCLLCGDKSSCLLTISEEPHARLWDLATHRQLKDFQLGHLDSARVRHRVIPSRDGHLMALQTESNTVRVLSTDSGLWIGTEMTSPAEIFPFALSAAGRLAALGSSSEVALRRVDTGQQCFAAVALPSPPQELAFSEDGRWLACACKGKILVINTATGAKEPEINADAYTLWFLGRTELLLMQPSRPDGPQLTLLDAHTGKEAGPPYGQPDFDARWHGDLLFSSKELWGYFPSTLRLVDAATGLFQAEPFIHEGPFCAAKLRHDGRVAATASQDRTVRIWSAEMQRAAPLTLSAGSEVYEARWSPTGNRILTGSGKGKGSELRVWDAATGESIGAPISLEGRALVAQWAPDGTRFGALSQRSAAIWDAETRQPLSLPLVHGEPVTACAFSPDGELFATAAEDRTIRIWNGHTGSPVCSPLVHSYAPLSMSFSSDGRRIASGDLDGTLRVWSVPDGKLILGPLGHGGVCWMAAFSPDMRLLVSASSDNTAQLWDATTGKPAHPAFRHEAPVLWASFSPDGRAVATATEFGTARVWDTTTGQLLSQPMHQPGKIWSVKWTSDGRFLATSSTEGTACLWDARTGHLVAEPIVHRGEVRRAEFSPDGHHLLTASYDGTVKVWDLALLRPPLPAPDWLPMLAESLGGKRLGPKDSLESVPGTVFQTAKARVERSGTNDYYGRWGQWLLKERFERPVRSFQQ
jgi:WD40 repeat protein